MKFLIVALCAVGCALGEAPYPAAGSRPQGAVLEYGAPPLSGGSTTFQSTETEDLAKIAERLRQEQGTRASSYVFLNDGRLQNGQYTTASFRNGQQWNSGIQQYSAPFNQIAQDHNGLNSNGDSSRLQQDYLPPQLNQQYYNQQRNGDYQQFSQQQNGQYFQQQSSLAQEYGLPDSQQERLQDELQEQHIQQLEQRQQQLEQQLRQQQEELKSANYLASLRYADPITSPDYSYKPPARVFRYAPKY